MLDVNLPGTLCLSCAMAWCGVHAFCVLQHVPKDTAGNPWRKTQAANSQNAHRVLPWPSRSVFSNVFSQGVVQCGAKVLSAFDKPQNEFCTNLFL